MTESDKNRIVDLLDEFDKKLWKNSEKISVNDFEYDDLGNYRKTLDIAISYFMFRKTLLVGRK